MIQDVPHCTRVISQRTGPLFNRIAISSPKALAQLQKFFLKAETFGQKVQVSQWGVDQQWSCRNSDPELTKRPKRQQHVKNMWRACSLGECSNDNEHSDFGCWRHRLLESGSLVVLKWFHAGTDNYGKLGLFKQAATAKFDSIQHPRPRISRVQVLTCQRYPEVVDLCSDLFWCASWTKHYQTWQQMAQELKSWVLQGLPGFDPSIPERASCPASLWRGSCKIMQKGA